MASLDGDNDWNQPLLASSPSPLRHSDDDESAWNADEESLTTVENPASRDVENDVIPETATVGRHIGWFSAYMIIISRILGSGIFATPGLIFQSAGSVGLSLLLWVIGALISWLALTIGLEYGCALPRSGGYKVYLEFTYRHPRFLASTIVAVHAVLLGFTASNCIIFGEYVLYALGCESTQWSKKTLAAVLLTVITIIHGCFLKAGIRIQNALGWVKIALIIVMVFTSLFVVMFRRGNHGISSAPESSSLKLDWTSIWAGSVWNLEALATGLFKVFYSYAGAENLNNVLNEVKNPVKTLRSVAPKALATMCVLYVLINIAYLLVIPLEEIKESKELIAALFFTRTFGDSIGRIILPLVIASSAVGNVMVVTFALARLNQEIARQGFLPFSTLLSSTKPFGAPLGGLLVHYIPSLLVIILPPSKDVYSFILNVEGYAGQFISAAVGIGLLILRRTRPDLHRPFKASIPAVVFKIVFAFAMIASPFFPPKSTTGQSWFTHAAYALVGTSVFVIAIIYWYIWTVFLPKLGNYSLEEYEETLADGTTVTKLVHVHKT